MKCLLGSLMLLTSLAFPTSSIAADALQAFDGSWRGEGWAVQNPGAKREKIQCRLKASYIPPSKRLVVRGKCAVPGRKFNMKGTISEKKGNLVAGRWFNPFGSGSTAVKGSITEDGVMLGLSIPAKRGSKAQPHRLTWAKTKAGFTMVSHNLAAESDVSSVTFRR